MTYDELLNIVKEKIPTIPMDSKPFELRQIVGNKCWKTLSKYEAIQFGQRFSYDVSKGEVPGLIVSNEQSFKGRHNQYERR